MKIKQILVLAFMLIISFCQIYHVQGSIWWSLFKVERNSQRDAKNEHQVIDVYLKSKEKFQNFKNNLKLDEMKKKDESVRQIVNQLLGGRMGDASVLTDFYTPYF